METFTIKPNSAPSPFDSAATKLNVPKMELSPTESSSSTSSSSSSSGTNNDTIAEADDDDEKRDENRSDDDEPENIPEEEDDDEDSIEETNRLLPEPEPIAPVSSTVVPIAANNCDSTPDSSVKLLTEGNNSILPVIVAQDSVDYFGDDDDDEDESSSPLSPDTTTGPATVVRINDKDCCSSLTTQTPSLIDNSGATNNSQQQQQLSTATSSTSNTASTAIVGKSKEILPEVVLRKSPKDHLNSSSNHSYSHSHHQQRNRNNRHRKVRRLSSDESEYQRPPDGGWGWVVVFASFMINLIADGVSLSFGVIFVELVDYFGESKAKTAWVGSLFLSIPLITGPIASALTDHFGCRKVAVAGSILSAAGFFFGQFSTCIEHLFIAFSISGFGLALCYVTSIVSVAYYFEKRRSLATGLAVCGTGFGTFLFAPFLIYLLEQYKWRGTLMILSAVFLNIVCFGLLIRDLNIDTSRDGQYSSSSDSSSCGDSSEDSDYEDRPGYQSTSDIEFNLVESESNSLHDCNDLNCYHRRNHLHGSRSPNFLVTEPHLLSPPNLNSNSNLNSKNPNNNCRIRHISECEPTATSLPRVSASLINIPTFIKNNFFTPPVQSELSAGQNSEENALKKRTEPLPEEIFGELTFRRGGYLHNLIRYYPHLLGLFLPWNLEQNQNDLTITTMQSPPKEKQSSYEQTPLAPPTGNTITVPSIIYSNSENKSVEFNLPGLNLNRNESPIYRAEEETNLEKLPLTNGNASKIIAGNNEIDPKSSQMVTFSPHTANGSLFAAQRNNNRMATTNNGALIGSSSFNGRHHGHGHRHSHLATATDPMGLSGGNCLHNLRLQRGSLTYRSAMLIINKYRLKASSAPDIYRNSMATINGVEKRNTFFQNMKEILCDMVDLSNFRSIRYTIFCISNFFLYACIDVPYVYLPDQAVISGACDKETASLLISILGVFNTLGVVFVGYIGDKPWLDASFIYALFIAISGLSLAAIPLSNSYTVMAILSAVYGFTISANYSLVSVILVELISLDCFTNAYGLLLLVQGFGSLIGPPVAGWLYDITGSYDEAFYITGLCVLFSGMFVIPIGRKKNCFLWSPKFPLANLSPSSSKKSSHHSSASSSSSSSSSSSPANHNNNNNHQHSSPSSSSSSGSTSKSHSSLRRSSSQISSSSSVSLLFSNKPLGSIQQQQANGNTSASPTDIESGPKKSHHHHHHHHHHHRKHHCRNRSRSKHRHNKHHKRHHHHRKSNNTKEKDKDDNEDRDSRKPKQSCGKTHSRHGRKLNRTPSPCVVPSEKILPEKCLPDGSNLDLVSQHRVVIVANEPTTK